MERRFSQLEIASIVSHLMQFCEMTLGRMTVEGCKDFPDRLCHELARCTRGQIQLVLAERNHLKDAPAPNEEGFKTYVRFGSETYGWLVLLSAPDQSEEWYPTPGQRQMLAGICGLMLWMFEFACSVLLPLRQTEGLKGVRLSPREQEILQLLCQGWRFQEIARQLGVEEATVQRYQRGIRASLKEPLEPERVCALEVSVLAYLAGLFSPLADR